jgi:hypothetical protein
VGGFERDLVAELFELTDQALGVGACGSLLEQVVAAGFSVGLGLVQDVVGVHRLQWATATAGCWSLHHLAVDRFFFTCRWGSSMALGHSIRRPRNPAMGGERGPCGMLATASASPSREDGVGAPGDRRVAAGPEGGRRPPAGPALT